jgi:hypothetical protein
MFASLNLLLSVCRKQKLLGAGTPLDQFMKMYVQGRHGLKTIVQQDTSA